jgi:hypothetical protein
MVARVLFALGFILAALGALAWLFWPRPKEEACSLHS